MGENRQTDSGALRGSLSDKSEQKDQLDGIPERLSQTEYGTQSEINKRISEASDAIKRGSNESIRDAQEAGREITGSEKRELKYSKVEKEKPLIGLE